MTSLDDVERLMGQPDRTRTIPVKVFVNPRLMRRRKDTMPKNSFSWFVRTVLEAFFEEMAELPRDAAERACKLLAAELASKRTGGFLKVKPRA